MPKKRNQNTEKLKRVLYIYCEGEKTEPLYFQGYIDGMDVSSRRFVVKLTSTKKNTPRQIVDVACSFRRSKKFVEGDLIWVVYDRESPAKYSERLHAEAYIKAKENGVRVGISNVCFEFWLLLHLQDTTAPFDSFTDFYANSDFRRLFRDKSGRDYEKSGRYVFSAMQPSIAEARSRAKKIRASMQACNQIDPPYRVNPYTNIDELLDDIDKLDGEN